VTLDNATTTANGQAADPGLFQFPLFSAADLMQGMHTVVLTNVVNDKNLPFVDLDFIIWESKIGLPSEKITNTTVQDVDPLFTYQPPLKWNTNPANLNNFNGHTGQ
jgi:hypothetical protein